MSAPQLPAEEALQGWVGLVDQRPTAAATELEGAVEVAGLLVVEDVALAVVGGRAARRLVPERWASLDRQRLGSR